MGPVYSSRNAGRPAAERHLSFESERHTRRRQCADRLEPLDITVGCGQRLTLEPCLQLSLDAPECTNSQTASITGSVRSCGNAVAQISYTLNGGPVQTIYNNCGGTLQGADDLTGPWADVPGATSPYAVATSAAQKFYRVKN